MYEKAELNILKNRVTNLELEIMSLKAEIKFLRMDIVHTMSQKINIKSYQYPEWDKKRKSWR